MLFQTEVTPGLKIQKSHSEITSGSHRYGVRGRTEHNRSEQNYGGETKIGAIVDNLPKSGPLLQNHH